MSSKYLAIAASGKESCRWCSPTVKRGRQGHASGVHGRAWRCEFDSLPCVLKPQTLIDAPLRGSVHVKVKHVDGPGSQEEVGQEGHGDEADASHNSYLRKGSGVVIVARIVLSRAFDGPHQIESKLCLEGNVPQALQLSLLVKIEQLQGPERAQSDEKERRGQRE